MTRQSLGSRDVLGDGDKLRGRLRRDGRLGLGSSRALRLLEVSAGTRGTLGSGLLRVDSFGGWDRRRAHVGAPFAKRRLGLGRRGRSESDSRVGSRLDGRIDTSLDWWRSLDGDGLLAILGVSLLQRDCRSTYLAGRRAKLLHELINSHDGSRGWGIGRRGKVLARTIDLDMTSWVVIFALDSPIGADIGLAGMVGSDLTGGKRHSGNDARQRRFARRDSRSVARRVGCLSELEAIVSSGAHESSDSRVIVLGQMTSLVTDGSGECGFDQRLEGVSRGRRVLHAEGSMGHGSGIEGDRGGVESRFRLFLDGIVVGMSGLERQLVHRHINAIDLPIGRSCHQIP
jgi:hypothetical protein